MGRILATGHSRVPVYSGNPKNIIGLLLVCLGLVYGFSIYDLAVCSEGLELES